MSNEFLLNKVLIQSSRLLVVAGLINLIVFLVYITQPSIFHQYAIFVQAFDREYLSIFGIVNAVWWDRSVPVIKLSLFWDEPGQMTLIFWLVLVVYVYRFKRLDLTAYMLSVLPAVSLSLLQELSLQYSALWFCFSCWIKVGDICDCKFVCFVGHYRPQ